MGISFFKLLVVVLVILIVFGAGKLPKVMEDLGKGLKSFKDALNDNPADKPIAPGEVKIIDTSSVGASPTVSATSTPEPKDL